jgi:hypothetical protein
MEWVVSSTHRPWRTLLSSRHTWRLQTGGQKVLKPSATVPGQEHHSDCHSYNVKISVRVQAKHGCLRIHHIEELFFAGLSHFW